MYNKCKRLEITQAELKKLVTYNPKNGLITSAGGYKINNGHDITFHLQGNRYYLSDIAYVYMEGIIPEGYKVGFSDNNKHNLKFTNLYLY